MSRALRVDGMLRKAAPRRRRRTRGDFVTAREESEGELEGHYQVSPNGFTVWWLHSALIPAGPDLAVAWQQIGDKTDKHTLRRTTYLRIINKRKGRAQFR